MGQGETVGDGYHVLLIHAPMLIHAHMRTLHRMCVFGLTHICTHTYVHTPLNIHAHMQVHMWHDCVQAAQLQAFVEGMLESGSSTAPRISVLTLRQACAIVPILLINGQVLFKLGSDYGPSAVFISPAVGWALPLAAMFLLHAWRRVNDVFKPRAD